MKVISKQAIIETLKNGGKITENIVYQERRVYNADGECIGAARWDTVSKLQKAGEIVKHSGGWSMVDTYTAARTYAEERAAELAEIVTRLEAGETAEEIGGGAFGLAACIKSVMFYRDTLHMDAAAIMADLEDSERKNGAFFNRAMWDAFDALFPYYRESIRAEAATRAELASAGMLAEEPAEEPAELPALRNVSTGETIAAPARALYNALRYTIRSRVHDTEYHGPSRDAVTLARWAMLNDWRPVHAAGALAALECRIIDAVRDRVPGWYPPEYALKERLFESRRDALCENVPPHKCDCNRCPARDLCAWLDWQKKAQ